MAKRSRIETLGILPRGIKEKISELELNDTEKERLIELMVIIVNNYEKKEISLNVAYPFPTTYIYKILTNRYSKLLDILVENDLLKRHGPYSKKKCYKYTINCDVDCIDFEIYSYIRRVNIRMKENELIKYTYKMLHKLELSNEISIEEMVKGRESEIVKKVEMKNKRMTKKNKNAIILHQIKREELALTLIKNKKFRASINETNGRLDTNITNLPSYYLKYITFNGERVSGDDVKNSQFTFLSNMIQYSLQSEEIESWVDIKNTLEECISLYGGRIMHYHNAVFGANDIYQFSNSAIQGTLYTDFMQISGVETREESKKVFFKILFGNEGKYKSTSVLREIFSNSYPTVFKSIVSFKEIMIEKEKIIFQKDNEAYTKKHRKGSKHKGYSKVGSAKFVNMLARMESYIIIDKILPILKKKRLYVLTKHDSIIIPESQADKARKIFFNELKKYLPFGFTMEQEIYGKDPVLFKYNPLLINEQIFNIAS